MPGQKPPVSCLISCEHAVNRVPDQWLWLFEGRELELESHRGWDRGALELALALADEWSVPLLQGQVSRLLIDLNRSHHHRQRFSRWTRPLPEAARSEIEQAWWQPHWQAYRHWIESLPPPVVHLACHSFTPVFDGRERHADIGLLYDPSRAGEVLFCRQLRSQLKELRPDLRVRMNYPYRGTANGLGQQHRKYYGPDRLVTIEIEINQQLVDLKNWPQTIRNLVAAASQVHA